MNARHRGRLVAAVLDVVQRRRPDGAACLIRLVPFGDAGVHVPAVDVEPGRVGDRAHLRERAVLQFPEADDDVGHLDAGVVDVVLHLDGRAGEAERADERVAQRGVPQVADVRRLVRVDGRVLDDGLAGRRGRRRRGPEPGQQERRTIEEAVQVAVRRRLDAGDARHRPQCGRQLLGDDPWRLPQGTGELEGDGDRQVAERAVRRHLDGDLGQVEVRVQPADGGADLVADFLFNGQQHDDDSRFDSFGVVRYDDASRCGGRSR